MLCQASRARLGAQATSCRGMTTCEGECHFRIFRVTDESPYNLGSSRNYVTALPLLDDNEDSARNPKPQILNPWPVNPEPYIQPRP